jgi:hypothetical protein
MTYTFAWRSNQVDVQAFVTSSISMIALWMMMLSALSVP